MTTRTNPGERSAGTSLIGVHRRHPSATGGHIVEPEDRDPHTPSADRAKLFPGSAVGVVKASAATGILCYLVGCFQIVMTVPAHACPDLLELRPTVHLVRYDWGFLPLRATCHWDNGAHQDFVSGWVNPLALTCAVVLTSVLVTALVLSYGRLRNRMPAPATDPSAEEPPAQEPPVSG